MSEAEAMTDHRYTRPEIAAALIFAAIPTAPLLIWLPWAPVVLWWPVVALLLLPLTQERDEPAPPTVWAPPTAPDPDALRAALRREMDRPHRG